MAPAADGDVAGRFEEHGGAGVEVVQEVYEQGFQGLGLLGGAVLLLALVAEHYVRELEGELLWEAGSLGGVSGDDTVAQDHVSLEATLSGIGEAAALPGELLCLADIVKDGPEDQQIPVDRVDLRERLRHSQAMHRVLQKPSETGVMHGLRRRRRAKGLPQLLIGDHARKKLSEVRVFEGAACLDQLLCQRLAVPLRGREVVLLLDLALREDPHSLDLYLEHPAVLVGVALDVDILGAAQAVGELGGEPPHTGVDRAGLVHELR